MADKDVEMLLEEFKKHFRAFWFRSAEATSRPELVLPPEAPGVVIVFEIATGAWLDRRAARALALINEGTEERLRHTGHWQTFYRHDNGCPSEDSHFKCTCPTVIAECHPISDEQANALRANDSLYDTITVMKTEKQP